MKKTDLQNTTATLQSAEQPFFKNRTILIILAVVLIVIACLIWYATRIQTNVNILKAETKQEAIIKKIDSLKTKQADVITDLKTSSQSKADYGNKLIKTLPDEKIIVSDTTYDAMLKYIQNYRPNQ